MKEVLLLIPAYNEEESIGDLLQKLNDADFTFDTDVLVINDASTDSTAWIARKYGAKVITHVINLGYGSALQTGYKYAARNGYKYVIQFDADGQHDVCNVQNIYDELTTPDENGEYPHIVLGSRFLQNSVSFYVSKVKQISIKFFRMIIKMLTHQQILDPTSGLQGLNYEAFLYYSIYNNFDNMYPDANMIIQMLLKGYRVREIPSVMHERVAGESMHSGIIKPLIYMMIMPISIFCVYRRDKLNLQKSIKIYSKEEK